MVKVPAAKGPQKPEQRRNIRKRPEAFFGAPITRRNQSRTVAGRRVDHEPSKETSDDRDYP